MQKVGDKQAHPNMVTLTRGQARGVECREDIQHPGQKGGFVGKWREARKAGRYIFR